MSDFILQQFKKEAIPTKLAQLVYFIVGAQLMIFLDVGFTIVGFFGFVLLYVFCLGMIKLNFSDALTFKKLDDKIKKDFMLLFQDLFFILNLTGILAVLALVYKNANYLTMAFDIDCLIMMISSFFYYILEG